MPPKRKKKPPNPPGSCKDCLPGGSRPAPYPGPRCATHDREFKRSKKDRSRDSYLRRTYGISEDEYNALKAYQGGRCFICRRATGASKNLAVDHDHRHCPGKTGCRECVRGLLCSTCNQKVLGHLRDDIEAFRRVISYLENPPAQEVLRERG
jgi:hypothetical protein